MDLKTLIFIGRSGSGKGTQAKLVIEYLKSQAAPKPVLYVETGALFREFIRGPGLSQKLASQIMLVGGRFPDFLAVWNWSEVLVRDYSGVEHLVFDGAPRGLLEAQAIDTALKFYGRQATIVYLNVSNDWATARLQGRGRVDDHGGDISNRLAWFDRDVMPAVEWYRAQPDYKFVEINGEQAPEVVQAAIIQGL